MSVATLDLASKFSAFMVRERAGEVLVEFDSAGLSAFQFVTKVANAIKRFQPELILVEDVPYGISSQAMIKPVLRLQGILIAVLHDYLDRMVFVNPSTWQKTFPGVARGKPEDRIEAARSHAEALGYTPPDLVAAYVASLPEGTKVLKKHTKPLEKSMTDFVDAFLMSHWAYSFTSFDLLRATAGVQVVYIRARKKNLTCLQLQQSRPCPP